MITKLDRFSDTYKNLLHTKNDQAKRVQGRTDLEMNILGFDVVFFISLSQWLFYCLYNLISLDQVDNREKCLCFVLRYNTHSLHSVKDWKQQNVACWQH